MLKTPIVDPVGGQRGWHGEGEICSDVAVSNKTPAITLLKNGCTYYSENSFSATKGQARFTLEWLANSGPTLTLLAVTVPNSSHDPHLFTNSSTNPLQQQ